MTEYYGLRSLALDVERNVAYPLSSLLEVVTYNAETPLSGGSEIISEFKREWSITEFDYGIWRQPIKAEVPGSLRSPVSEGSIKVGGPVVLRGSNTYEVYKGQVLDAYTISLHFGAGVPLGVERYNKVLSDYTITFTDDYPRSSEAFTDIYILSLLNFKPVHNEFSYSVRYANLPYVGKGYTRIHKVSDGNLPLRLSNQNALLFDAQSNVVDFNDLSMLQIDAIGNGSNIYNSLSGNDVITLPDESHISLIPSGGMPPVIYNFAKVFDSNDGADTFDFTKPGGLTGYSVGRTLYITGGGQLSDRKLGYGAGVQVDRVSLPGAPGDYTYTVDFGSSGTPDPAVVRTIIANTKLGISLDTTELEKADVAQPISNPVAKLHLGSLYAEAALLSAEVYGPDPDKVRPNERLAYQVGHVDQETTMIGDDAVARGWHEVAALELGMPAADFGLYGDLSYSFSNGHYQAIDGTGFSGVTTEANALVLTGVVNGMKTLAVVFRGTDQYSDFGDYFDFRTQHYAKFKPLVEALKTYAASSGVDQVLVAGHSLGGGVAQLFANDLAGGVPPGSIQLFTFGSPGAEDEGQVPNQINIFHTQDLVAALLSDLSRDTSAKGLALKVVAGGVLTPLIGPLPTAALLTAIQPKFRSGSEVALNSDLSKFYSVAEHAMGDIGTGQSYIPRTPGAIAAGYINDVGKLVLHAQDSGSALYGSSLAQAIRADTALVPGGVPQIAIGTGASAGGVMHVDRNDRYVLGDFGQTDVIRWNDSSSINKDIDGGHGGDLLVLTGGSWSWTKVGDHYDLYKAGTLFGNSLKGTFRRLDTVVNASKFATGLATTYATAASPVYGEAVGTIAATAAIEASSLVTHLDGTPTTVQQAAPGSMVLTADGTSDVTYAGPGVTDLQSSMAGAVLLYGADTARVIITGGEATIVSDGSMGGAVAIDTGSTSSMVIGGARAQAIVGRLAGATFQGGTGDSTVTYAGGRSAYTLTVEDDGATTVSDIAGVGADRLVNIQRVTFDDQTVEITTTLVPDPDPHFVMTDVTANITSSTIGEPNNGPGDYLRNLFIHEGPNNVAIVAQTDNVLIKSGSGNDALQAHGGKNVLDGSTGSNFLVGATGTDGGTDTFFTDARSSETVWNTLVNFHEGDAVTLWGFVDGISTWGWDGISGADGYTGATLRADVRATGTKDASITFAGLSIEQAQDLQVASGVVGGNPYLYFFNAGV